jgi:hypothetical protein
MAEANRVHSTPRTNTSAINPANPTRRGFIAVVTGANIISVGAVAMPIAAGGLLFFIRYHRKEPFGERSIE